MSKKPSHGALLQAEDRKRKPEISEALRKNWTMAHIRPELLYKRDTADLICSIVSQGKTVAAAARMVGVPVNTVFGWSRRDIDGFAERLEAAREDCIELMVDEIIEISDDARRDIEINNKTGNPSVNHEVVARSKLKIETRKWIAAMVKPNRYGDKLQVKQDVTLKTVSDEPQTAAIDLAKEEWTSTYTNGNGKH